MHGLIADAYMKRLRSTLMRSGVSRIPPVAPGGHRSADEPGDCAGCDRACSRNGGGTFSARSTSIRRNGAAQLNLANALFDHGDHAAAAVPAERAVSLRPDNPAAHDMMGRVLAVQGQLAAAIGQFEQAIRLNPQYAEAREHLARVSTSRDRRTSGLR